MNILYVYYNVCFDRTIYPYLYFVPSPQFVNTHEDAQSLKGRYKETKTKRRKNKKSYQKHMHSLKQDGEILVLYIHY